MKPHPDAGALLALLLFFDARLDDALLCSLTEWEAERFEATVSRLIEAGLLAREPDGLLQPLAGAERAARAWLAAPEGDFRFGTCFACIRRANRGEQLEALTDLHLFCRRLAERAEEHAAILCYDRLLAGLARLPMRHAPVENIRRYIALCLDAQALTFYFLHAVDAAILMLFRARGIAHAIGDLRSIALINLAIGSMGGRPTDRHNSPRLHAIMRRGVASTNILGDEDILEQASLYLGIYHFIEGRYDEALAHFAQAGHAPTAWELRQDLLTIYTSSCCAYRAEFDAAISIVSTGWRNARLSGHSLAARAIQTQLAMLHLQSGNVDESLAHLDEVISSIQSGREPVTWVWSHQALAFYHFLQGRLEASHAVMRECMRHSVQRGTRRPIYMFPWLLELLSAYAENGLPPIEGYVFDEELEHALHGPNRLMQAVGLRLAARRRLRAGGGSTAEAEGIQRDFEKSLAIGREIEDRFEMLHSSIALTEFHLGQGDREKALRHAAEAWRVFQRYGRPGIPVWPEAVLDLVAGMPVPEMVSRPDVILEQVQDALASLGAKNGSEADNPQEIGPEEFQRVLLKTVCSVLGATRGVLFRYTPPFFGDPAPQPVALFSLSGQVRPNALADIQDFMHAVLRDHKCGFEQRVRDGAEQSFLGLPLSANPGIGYGLYLEGGFFQSVSACFSPSFLERLQSLIERECSLFHRFHSTFEARKGERIRALSQEAGHTPDAIQYRCEAMQHCLLRADLAAESDAPVLVLGESGVGKELLGRRIHMNSGRSGPFVTVNSSDIPEDSFESELFGHEKGAFTGALRQRQGLLELADKGTLFIDDVCDVVPRVLNALLHALQERSFMRVGGTRPIASDFRLSCATNREIANEAQRGLLSRDLYYRISVIPITLPPLREREGDVIHLARHFLEYYARKNKLPVPDLGKQEIARLLTYSWPGNVRELRNIIERAVILSRNGPLRLSLDLPFPPVPAIPAGPGEPFAGLGKLPSLKELQGLYIEHVLRRLNWKIDGPEGAARILGLNRSSLYSRMKTLGLQRPDGEKTAE